MKRSEAFKTDTGSLVVEMKNLIRRVTLALVFIPLLLIFIFLTPHYNHLLLNLLIVALSVIGGVETRHLFAKRNTHLSYPLTIVLSAVLPVCTLLFVMGFISQAVVYGVFLFTICLIVTITALTRNKEKISSVMNRLPAYCFILIFPGFFMSYLIRINLFADSSLFFLIFLTFVFGNDTFAYFFGMLFGKGNRGIFPVSPNKSAAGLVGGLAAAAGAAILYFSIFPELFKNDLLFAILIGVCTAATSVIGDLLESAMKRSADEKDSGTLMKGRGGVLDTIDSVLFSAPLFYYLVYQLLILNG